MISRWRAQATAVRYSSLLALSKLILIMASGCVLYALAGIYGGWWNYCTHVGPDKLLLWPVADPHVPLRVASIGETVLGLYFIKVVRFVCALIYLWLFLIVISFMRGEFRRGQDTFRGYMAMLGFGLCLIPISVIAWLVYGAQSPSLITVAGGLVIVGYGAEPLITRYIIRHHKLRQRTKVMEFLIEREAARIQLQTWRELCTAKANNEPLTVRGRAAADIGTHPLGKPAPSKCQKGCCGSTSIEVPMTSRPKDRMSVEELRALLEQQQGPAGI